MHKEEFVEGEAFSGFGGGFKVAWEVNLVDSLVEGEELVLGKDICGDVVGELIGVFLEDLEYLAAEPFGGDALGFWVDRDEAGCVDGVLSICENFVFGVVDGGFSTEDFCSA